MDGWVDGSKSRFKDCLQQSKSVKRRAPYNWCAFTFLQSELHFIIFFTQPKGGRQFCMIGRYPSTGTNNFMQLSLEHCIDPKDHKSEDDYKSIAVEGAIWPKL